MINQRPHLAIPKFVIFDASSIANNKYEVCVPYEITASLESSPVLSDVVEIIGYRTITEAIFAALFTNIDSTIETVTAWVTEKQNYEAFALIMNSVDLYHDLGIYLDFVTQYAEFKLRNALGKNFENLSHQYLVDHWVDPHLAILELSV